MSKTKFYSGTVAGVRYWDDTFRIMRVLIDGDKKGLPVTVKGNFPGQNVQAGSWVTFEGRWTNHPEYGKQLQAVRSPVPVNDWTDDRVDNALMAHGVGPSVRFGIEMAAGDAGLSMFEFMEVGDLSSVEGLDNFGQVYTLTRWKSLRTYLDAASFMADAGLPANVLAKVWSTFGDDLQDVITDDPWILVRVAGISFEKADEIALRLGVSLDNPGRVRGAVLSAVQETVNEGHVFATTSQVVERVRRTIPGQKDPVSPQEIAAPIGELNKTKSLQVVRDIKPGFTALYDKWHLMIEETCAELLATRMATPLDEDHLRASLLKVGDRVRDADGDDVSLATLAHKALENWEEGKHLTLTKDQKKAVVQALTSQISLHTGLPGTGKTTILQAVVSLLRDAEVPLVLVAPTGIAAKRMSALTGAEASTIHRAFGAKGFKSDDQEREATYMGIVGERGQKTSGEDNAGEDWEYGPGRPHPAKFVVVDESSMLDLHMLYRLLIATSNDCRILFVGDPYQLPSVGSGDVLRDLVRVGLFPHAKLTKIFRQKDTSGIILAAHQVHTGRTPSSDGKDFVILPAGDEEEACEKVVELAGKLYDRSINFQVLSPRHGGDAGVTNLNQRLRKALNPAGSGTEEMRLGSAVVREGDRVMIVKNDYDNQVYNGDVGKVRRIDRKAKEIEIKVFEGVDAPPRYVRYKFKDASKVLRLAYAQTVHKSQGQEYDVIVLPVLKEFGRQLQRNLFYTAITRAKKKVFLVGSAAAVARAVENNKAEGRNTLLSERIRLLLGG